jgi:transposase
MNRQNVTNWCREFSEGWTDVHDDQWSGKPSLISDEILQEIEGEIRANRSVTIRELHHITPEVFKTTIHEEVRQRSKIAYRSIVRREHQSILRRIHGTIS